VNRVVVPAAALAAVALAGCGSSSSSPARPSPSSAGASSAPVASANLNGEQAKPAQQVLADAKSALFNAPSVHVKGTQTQAGKSQKLDVQFQGEDAAGTITIAGIPLNIVKTAGKVYVKAPAPFWVKTVGATVAPKLANRWLEQDAAKAGNATTLTLQGVAASLNSDDSPLKSAVATTDVDGQKAVVLTQQDGSQLAVANTGAPLPLKLTTAGTAGTAKGALTFTGYGHTQTITPPPGAVTAQQAAKAPSTGTA